jgi:hypothetical protein
LLCVASRSGPEVEVAGDVERVVGGVWAEDHYSDGFTGFNPAVTLSRYDSKGAAAPLSSPVSASSYECVGCVVSVL